MPATTRTFIATVADQVTDYAKQFDCTYADAIWDWEGDGPNGSYVLATEERVEVSRELRRRGVKYIDDKPLEQSTLTCPACESEQSRAQAFMGALGDTQHYRCRHCGIEWHE